MTPALAACGISVRHAKSDFDALRDVHLSVRQGELLALVGPNGSGKSTALASLARTLKPRTGHIELDGADARGLTRREFARAVARLPQNPSCPEGLTVEQLVVMGRHAHHGMLAGLDDQDRAAVMQALRTVDALDLRQRLVETLSGGERRRAWLAMVLCQDARVLLLDEPTAGLDLRHEREVLTFLARLTHERGTTIAVVLHDLEHAASIADRIAVLYRGRVYDVGPPARCLNEEMLRDVFGVDARVRVDTGTITIEVRGAMTPRRRL